MGARPVDESPQSVQGAPEVAAESELVDPVGLVCLGPMMSTPERRLVVVAGLARWPVGLVGIGMVAVEASGLALGVREDVAGGAQDASLLDACGVLVLVDRAAGVEVDDRLELEVGDSTAAWERCACSTTRGRGNAAGSRASAAASSSP
jgi:hypothetical protein